IAAGSISTRVPEGRPLKKLTTPPRRTIARACCHVAGFPAASTTESGPRWSSVRAFTATTTSDVSVTLTAATAPKRRALVVDRVRHFEHVFHDDAPGDAHVFCVRAVVKQQVVAKIFLAAAAVVATQARSGIRGDNAHPDAPTRIHALAHGDNLTHQLVTEDRRRLNHLRVIAALPNLEVGTVGERQTDA